MTEKNANTQVDNANTQADLVTSADLSVDLFHRAHQQAQDPGVKFGTGFTEIDDFTGGLHRGGLVVVAGRPGLGKTCFVLNVAAYSMLRESKRVLLFAPDADATLVLERILYSEAWVDASRVHQGLLDERDFERMADIAGRLSVSALTIDDIPDPSVIHLIECAETVAENQGVDLIIVDPAQLIRGETTYSDRHEEVASVARHLKVLARKLSVPVIVTVQVNRAVELRPNKRPQLSDLRESSVWEELADVVLGIYREEVYDPYSEAQGIAEVLLLKNLYGKNSPFGYESSKLFFDGARKRFSNLA